MTTDQHYTAHLHSLLALVTGRMADTMAVIEARRNLPTAERGPEFEAALATHTHLSRQARSLRETIANPEPREP